MCHLAYVTNIFVKLNGLNVSMQGKYKNVLHVSDQISAFRGNNYYRRESFKSDLGVEFDPFGAVETASEMTLNLLLNPQRASRLIAHKSLNKRQLGLVELIDELVVKSIKKTHKDTYYQELQNVINTKVLEQLFVLAANKNQYKQVNAIVFFKLGEIKTLLKNKNDDEVQKIYNIALIKMIDDFVKNPTSFKKTYAPKIPDGSPIGNDYKH